REVGRERKRPLEVAGGFGPPPRLGDIAFAREEGRDPELGPGGRVIRIDREGLAKQGLRLARAPGTAPAVLGPRFGVERVDVSAGRDILGPAAASGRHPAADQSFDLVGDALLEREDVVELAPDLIAPDLRFILRASEAELHAHL